MKILYCITRSQWGGAQSHLFDLVCAQVLKGNDVVLVVGEKGDLTDRLEKKKIQCKILELSTLVRSISPIKDIRSVMKFRKIIKHEKPDIVHLHSSKAGTIGRLSCLFLSDVKVIFTVHGWAFTDGVSKNKAKIFVLVERVLSRHADRIICVSKFDYDIALKKKIFKCSNGIVVYNGVSADGIDTEELDYAEEHIDEYINFIMVARFSKVQKRQDLLIDAANLLSQKGQKNYRLTFIGDGEELTEAKKLVEKYKLSDRTVFLGFQEEPMRYLNDKSILTLISDYEGLPISIIEGMSLGRPILASDVGGVNELVQDELNGFLTTRNPYEIMEDMEKFILLSEKEFNEFGANSRQLYLDNFTKEKFIKETFKVYDFVFRNAMSR